MCSCFSPTTRRRQTSIRSCRSFIGMLHSLVSAILFQFVRIELFFNVDARWSIQPFSRNRRQSEVALASTLPQQVWIRRISCSVLVESMKPFGCRRTWIRRFIDEPPLLKNRCDQLCEPSRGVSFLMLCTLYIFVG